MSKQPTQDWSAHRAVERPVEKFSPHGDYTLALAYANEYHVGMSSLAFQRVYELVQRTPGWTCERFFADGLGGFSVPVSVELDTPLDAFGAIAFSISFEEDYVHFLEMLIRAGIPLRRSQRSPKDPVIIVGGSCAMINPLPLAEFVDVFPLGAAENVLPELLSALEEENDRRAIGERLAAREGFFVPEFHRPEDEAVFKKLEKLELSEEQMRRPGVLPTTAIVTPKTEFSEKFLVEMSRGCPEKCRYCWATFGMGRFRWHPTEYILESFERARPVTDQLGFVATAVGDHPEIEKILWKGNAMGFRTSVSSVRIPAVTEGVLAALHASGDRAITLAPETGSDELRVKLNKPLSNELLLEKVRLIFRQGMTQLKLYFIIGLPGETDADVEAILDLADRCRRIMLEELTPSGVIGHVHLGANILVPKPYTAYQRQTMEEPRVLKKRIALLKRGVAALPNVSLGTMSIRQAMWQSYITKAGSDAAEVLEAAARGETIASLLRRFDERIHPEVFGRRDGRRGGGPGGRLRWQFLKTG
ncbi:MAG: B12-binding domain-containing radical SAM protein [Acidobacteriota bacterium]|nr:B12-binding domain-containing radical SAM protein [Acidobacteriota bacterium]